MVGHNKPRANNRIRKYSTDNYGITVPSHIAEHCQKRYGYAYQSGGDIWFPAGSSVLLRNVDGTQKALTIKKDLAVENSGVNFIFDVHHDSIHLGSGTDHYEENKKKKLKNYFTDSIY